MLHLRQEAVIDWTFSVAIYTYNVQGHWSFRSSSTIHRIRSHGATPRMQFLRHPKAVSEELFDCEIVTNFTDCWGKRCKTKAVPPRLQR